MYEVERVDSLDLKFEISQLNERFIRAWMRQAVSSMSFRTSQWPAHTGTSNRSKISRLYSVNLFGGRFRRLSERVFQIAITNRARNKSGVHYAAAVNQGRNQYGRFRAARFKADYDAVGRTIRSNQNRIARYAEIDIEDGDA